VLVAAQSSSWCERLGSMAGVVIDIVGDVRSLDVLDERIDQVEPAVVMIDTAFPDGAGFGAIAASMSRAPVLAVTPAPPPPADVARAMRAGASGFVPADSDNDEVVAATTAIHDGGRWLPPDRTQLVLSELADDLEVTTTERRSRLTTIVLGAIPLAGVLAAILSLLWRRYLGQIGVRPVDLAIDPGSRVVDVVVGLLFAIGFFGPFLFIGTWLDQLGPRVENRRGLRWIARRSELSRIGMFLLVLAGVVTLAWYEELILALFVGPAVTIALVAAAFDVTAELPPFLRLKRLRLRRLVPAVLAIALGLLGILSAEALVRGPGFSPHGVEGIILHRLIGFSAKPVLVTEVASGEAREALYLGGNADLYVLVDPCDGDDVTYVSVVTTQLEIIDEVSC